VPRRRLATIISPAAAVLSFLALGCLYLWITLPYPAGTSIGYAMFYSVFFGLPLAYVIVAVFLFLPFRVMLARRSLTPRTVYAASSLFGALFGMSLWMFDPPLNWRLIGMATLFGSLSGLIGGLVFAHVGGPFVLTRRAR
jgi:hypothetical protein